MWEEGDELRKHVVVVVIAKFFCFLFFIEGYLLYRILLFSIKPRDWMASPTQ